MINLFEVQNCHIDTSKFSNILHDKIVQEFESNFLNYIGAPYGVAVSSATNAIFLLLRYLDRCNKYLSGEQRSIKIPSIIPPVVVNAAITAGYSVFFNDNVQWIGGPVEYTIYDSQIYLVDSAHEVSSRFSTTKKNNKVFIYSFYPTKPVGSCDGGFIASDNADIVEEIRILAYNGMANYENTFERKWSTFGYKMYMNSAQAYMANESLKTLPSRLDKLAEIREYYNFNLDLNNTSSHLYRIPTTNASKFMQRMLNRGIQCGKHYNACHHHPIVNNDSFTSSDVIIDERTMVSLPFHCNLTKMDLIEVCESAKELRWIS